MNLRVFVLIAAMAAFGALLSSDGRYQAEQLAIVRAQRACASNVAFVTRIGPVAAIPTVDRTAKPTISSTQDASEIGRTPVVLTLQALLAAEKTQPSLEGTANGIVAQVSQVSVERLAVAGILGIDPGNDVTRLTGGVALVKTRLEERFCLLRFRTRQTAYFASRRIATFLRDVDRSPSDGSRSDRDPRDADRGIPSPGHGWPPDAVAVSSYRRPPRRSREQSRFGNGRSSTMGS